MVLGFGRVFRRTNPWSPVTGRGQSDTTKIVPFYVAIVVLYILPAITMIGQDNQ